MELDVFKRFDDGTATADDCLEYLCSTDYHYTARASIARVIIRLRARIAELELKLANEKHTHQITKNTEDDLANQLAEALAERARYGDTVTSKMGELEAQLSEARLAIRTALAESTTYDEVEARLIGLVEE